MRLLNAIRNVDRNGVAEVVGAQLGRLLARARHEPARAATLGLGAALGLATVHNAAFGQTERHASPWFGDPVVTASVAPAEAREAAAPKSRRMLADPVVFGIQSELTDLGFYSGAIDGIAGSRTRKAIEAYETAQGLAPSGQATEALLGRIRVGAVKHLPRPSASPRRTPVEAATDETATGAVPERPVASGPDREMVRSVQRALIAAGEELEADGLMGPNTRAAIEAYEEDRGLPVTGVPAPALIAHMRDAGLVR